MKNMDNEKFVPAFHPYNITQAGLIQGALEQANMICYINNENASGIRFGGIGMGAARMTVMVPESQLEKSLQIISELGLG
jgi:hypothetical protein